MNIFACVSAGARVTVHAYVEIKEQVAAVSSLFHHVVTGNSIRSDLVASIFTHFTHWHLNFTLSKRL